MNWDRAGKWASGLCLIHCVAMPFVVSALPFLHVHFFGESEFHLLMALVIFAVAILAFWPGYKKHGKRGVFYVATPALVLILLGLALEQNLTLSFEPTGSEVALDEPLTILGGIMLITAHYMNHSFCGMCGKENHDH